MLLPMLVKATKYLNPRVAQVPSTQVVHATKSVFESHFTRDKATKRLALSALNIFR